ncbi:MAG TPA: hypothetical protein PKC59_16140, partial [Burkholderiaceae bacterium]|nr:hypothetical protein [Burkholderiaceae bacterium]
DEVQIEQDRSTLVIVRPGGQANQLPISADWQAWWNQQCPRRLNSEPACRLKYEPGQYADPKMIDCG